MNRTRNSVSLLFLAALLPVIGCARQIDTAVSSDSVLVKRCNLDLVIQVSPAAPGRPYPLVLSQLGPLIVTDTDTLPVPRYPLRITCTVLPVPQRRGPRA